MAKISDLISKYVISLFDGRTEGVVENILFDDRTNRAKYFIVYNADTDSKYAIPTYCIYSIGNGAISIKNSSYLVLCEDCEMELKNFYTPMNNNTFKVNGDFLGKVVDININDKYYIENLQLSNQETISIEDIASFNNDTIIVNDENNKVNVKNFFVRKKIPENVDDTRIVNILEIKDENKQTIVKETPVTTLIPNRAITNYNFLINRKVKKNITSLNGDVIIKQNTRINANVIDIARNNGKLTELTKYSS